MIKGRNPPECLGLPVRLSDNFLNNMPGLSPDECQSFENREGVIIEWKICDGSCNFSDSFCSSGREPVTNTIYYYVLWDEGAEISQHHESSLEEITVADNPNITFRRARKRRPHTHSFKFNKGKGSRDVR